jgi:hypothetical protein
MNKDINQFHGVVVITPDFESGNLGSNPGGTYFFFGKTDNWKYDPHKSRAMQPFRKGQILSLSDNRHQTFPWCSGYHSATWVKIPVGPTFFLDKQITHKYDPHKSRTIQPFGKG